MEALSVDLIQSRARGLGTASHCSVALFFGKQKRAPLRAPQVSEECPGRSGTNAGGIREGETISSPLSVSLGHLTERSCRTRSPTNQRWQNCRIPPPATPKSRSKENAPTPVLLSYLTGDQQRSRPNMSFRRETLGAADEQAF
jgi:hypothetical protein